MHTQLASWSIMMSVAGLNFQPFEFGWKAVNHVRLAMVVTMRSGITLQMANYTSNLPYLVAAQLDDGKEQFLCPIVGEVKPQFGQSMCKQSFTNYKNKKIRYGVFGFPPEFVPTTIFGNGIGNNDETLIDGISPKFLKMLAEKLKFYPAFTWSPSWSSLVNKVHHLCEESRQHIIIKIVSFSPAIEKLTYPWLTIYSIQDFTLKTTLLVLLVHKTFTL